MASVTSYPTVDLGSSEPLPTSPDEITTKWLSKILAREVQDVHIVSTIHGTASKILIHVTYAQEQDVDQDASPPARLCIKGGFNPALMAAYPALSAVYRTEAEFYAHLAPHLGLCLAPSWFCGTDTTTGQGLVVMTDLNADDGSSIHTFGDPVHAWPAERIRSGLRQLALLHGRTWGAEPEAFPWLRRDNFPHRPFVLSLFEKEVWDARFHGSDPPPPVPAELQDRERMRASLETLWAVSDATTRLRCVLHGDAHVGNTFFTSGDDDSVGFVDWQGVHPGSAMHDVGYFIVGALDVVAPDGGNEMKAQETDLLEYYLRELVQVGGPRLEVADVWDEYRMHHIFGFAWAVTGPAMQSAERVNAMTERYCRAIVENGTLELLESLGKGEGKQ